MSFATVMDKERLAAFVDGEMSPEEAAQVVLHLADHPVDKAYVDDLMAANEALAQAYASPIHEPVPAKIRDTILGRPQVAQIIPFRRSPMAAAGIGVALAASVAFVLVNLPDLWGAPTESLLAIGPVEDDTALDRALDTLLSGAPQILENGRQIMILATLPVEGGFCREVEVIEDAAERLDLGIVCSDGTGWTVEVRLSEPLQSVGTEDGFVAANGAEVQGLQPFLDRLGAGLPLTRDEESDVIVQGWAG